MYIIIFFYLLTDKITVSLDLAADSHIDLLNASLHRLEQHKEQLNLIRDEKIKIQEEEEKDDEYVDQLQIYYTEVKVDEGEKEKEKGKGDKKAKSIGGKGGGGAAVVKEYDLYLFCCFYPFVFILLFLFFCFYPFVFILLLFFRHPRPKSCEVETPGSHLPNRTDKILIQAQLLKKDLELKLGSAFMKIYDLIRINQSMNIFFFFNGKNCYY
jgi:hypothetical protein